MNVPVLLLSGCLGAGKTTVLRHLLAAEWVRRRNPALIINEFGRLGVDGRLLPETGISQFEINKGSLFCTCTQPQLIDTFQKISRDVEPGLVIIEASGMAATSGLDGALALPALTALFRLWANVCVVDAENFTQIAPFLKVAVDQVRWADSLIINKTDRVPPRETARLQEVLHSLNPRAPQTLTTFGEVCEEFCQNLSHEPRDGQPAEHPPEGLFALSFETDATVDETRFMDVLGRYGPSILRLKGNVDFGGDRRRFVEVVHGQFSEQKAAKGFSAATAFTVVGWNADCDAMNAAFDATMRIGS